MEEPIVNRVEESGLIQVDLASLLADARPTASVDLSEWLDQGICFVKSPFVKGWPPWDASQLEGHVVAMHCSSDAILPDWAWMLVAAKLQSLDTFSFGGFACRSPNPRMETRRSIPRPSTPTATNGSS